MSQDSYNNYADMPSYPMMMFQHLMENNELIWRLLGYNSPDAWNQSNLTKAEKGALIWAGEGYTNDFRCFMDDGQPDAETSEITLLHIMNYGLSPLNPTIGTVQILIEAYSHYKINTMSNYLTRVDVIMQQMLETFNGVTLDTLGSVGAISFDKLGSGSSRLAIGGQLPFRGKWMILTVKSGKST